MTPVELLFLVASRYPGMLRRWDFNSFRSFSFQLRGRLHPPHPLYSCPSDQAPVFIIGSGRSGNTVLRRLLMERFQIHIPPETYFLGAVIREYQRHRYLEWQPLAELMADKIIHSQGFHTFEMGSQDEFRRSMVAVEDRSLAGILAHFYRYQARSSGANSGIWGDKTPMNTFYLRSISGVFPAARYVWIIRDGIDVAASYIEAGLNKYTLDVAAKRWVVSNLACEQLHCRLGADQVIQIRYEDLVRDPDEVLSTIAQFSGLRPKNEPASQPLSAMGDVEKYQHHANVLNPINTDSIGKGRRQLDRADMQGLAKIIDPWLSRWGYQPTSSTVV